MKDSRTGGESPGSTSPVLRSPVTPETKRRDLLIYIAAPLVAILLYIVWINRRMPDAIVYEWGDSATHSMDVLRAKRFDQLLGQYSSRAIRQPGPWLAYIEAASEVIFYDLFHFASPYPTHFLGIAFHNLLFMFLTLYMLLRTFKHLILMIPVYVWFFLLQHAVFTNQLSLMVPHNMSASALSALLLSGAVIGSGALWPLPIYVLSSVVLVHIHAFNVAHVTLICVAVAAAFFYRRRGRKDIPPLRENRKHLVAAGCILLIGIFPLLYDQLFASGNISTLIAFSKNAQTASQQLPLGPRLGQAVLYIPAFYLMPWWGKAFTLKLAQQNQFYVGSVAGTIFWLVFATFGLWVVWRCQRPVCRLLMGLVSLGAPLVMHFAIMNGTLGWEVYGLNLFGYVIGLAFVVILVYDEIITRWRSEAIKIAGVTILTLLPPLSFADAKTFLASPSSFAFAADGIRRGFFDLQHWISSDARLGEMTDRILSAGQPIVLWMDEPEQWPIFDGVAAQLFRRGAKACIVDTRHWRFPALMLGNETMCATFPENGIDVHMSDKWIPYGKSIYENHLFISVVDRTVSPPQSQRPNEIQTPKVEDWSLTSTNGVLMSRISDPNGVQDISEVYMLLNSSLNRCCGCYIRYNRAANSLSLWNEKAGVWHGPLSMGARRSVTNDRCEIVGKNSSVRVEDKALVVEVGLNSIPQFAANRLHLYATEVSGANSGWFIVDNYTAVSSMEWGLGFEGGDQASWTTDGKTIISMTAAVAFSGKQSLMESGSGGGVFRFMGGLTPGRKYTVSAKVRSDKATWQALLWIHDTTGANLLYGPKRTPASDEWGELTVDFKATSTRAVAIHLYYSGGPGAIYWDDVRVVQALESNGKQ